MVKLSKKMDYSLLLVAELVRSPEELLPASYMVERYGLSYEMVSALLKNLCRKGILESVRGKNGGYRLARNPGEISLADMIEAVDGPVHLTDCSMDEGHSCRLHSICAVGMRLRDVNRQINRILEDTSLGHVLGMDGIASAPRGLRGEESR